MSDSKQNYKALPFWKTLLAAALLHSAVFAGVALEQILVSAARTPDNIVYIEAADAGVAAPIQKHAFVPKRERVTIAENDRVVPPEEEEQESEAADEGNSDSPLAAEHGVANGPVGGQGEVSPLATYKAQVRHAIETRRRYPGLSRSLGETGTVYVAFRVEHDGTITDVALQRPCGYERLNHEAVATLARVAHVEAIPAEIGRNQLDFVIPIDFQLN